MYPGSVLTHVEPEVLVDADLDTLAAALYARTDDLLNRRRRGQRGSPRQSAALAGCTSRSAQASILPSATAPSLAEVDPADRGLGIVQAP